MTPRLGLPARGPFALELDSLGFGLPARDSLFTSICSLSRLALVSAALALFTQQGSVNVWRELVARIPLLCKAQGGNI